MLHFLTMRIAELGSTKALFNLGVVHSHGLGVEDDCYHPRPRPSRGPVRPPPLAMHSAILILFEEGRTSRRSSPSAPTASPCSTTAGERPWTRFRGRTDGALRPPSDFRRRATVLRRDPRRTVSPVPFLAGRAPPGDSAARRRV